MCLITQTGFALLAPTWPSLVALACLTVAVRLQVRLIEEPHLVAVHGATYLNYAARTGRFLPGVGHQVNTPALATR